MNKLTGILIPIGILTVGIISMFVLFGMKSEPEKRSFQPQPKIVESVEVELGHIRSHISALGQVRSSQPVDLYCEVTGNIMPGEIPFLPAQAFRKGDLLLKIDDRQVRLSINSKKSELLSALANALPEIKIDFPQEYPVWQQYFDQIGFDQILSPLPQFENRKIKLYLARYNAYRLYYDIRDLEIQLDKHFIRAPFDGSVVTAHMRAGANARIGSHLGEIINLENLEVEIPLTAEELSWVDDNAPVQFTSGEIPGLWRGKITRIGSTIDQRTQTIPVFVTLDNKSPAGLYDGAYLTASIPGRSITSAFAAPRRAVYNDQFVYLVTDGHLERRDITIARQQGDQVIIEGGLLDNDTLVIDILQGVASGMPADARVKNFDRDAD